MKTIAQLTALLVCLLAALVGPAATTAADAPSLLDDNFKNYLVLLRSDFNSAKVDIVNRIMKLSAAEGEKFWPIYREYEDTLGKQAMNRAEFIAEFIDASARGTFDNSKAQALAKRWFKMQRARLDLLEKYHRKIEKALTSVQAGQFLQIENQIGLFIDIAIASEMPAVGDKAE